MTLLKITLSSTVSASKNNSTYKKEMPKTGTMMQLTNKTAKKYPTLSYWAKTKKNKSLRNGSKRIEPLSKRFIEELPP